MISMYIKVIIVYIIILKNLIIIISNVIDKNMTLVTLHFPKGAKE